MGKKEIEEVKKILKEDYQDLYIEALSGEEGKVYQIQQALENDKIFENFAFYGDRKKAKDCVEEIVGSGIIRYIVNKYDPTNISWDGSQLLIETNENTFVYNGKGSQNINNDYIEALINRYAQKEGHKGVIFGEDKPLFNGFDKEEHLRISANYENTTTGGLTMSIRVSKSELVLNKENFDDFAPMFIYMLLKTLIRARCVTIIDAEVGTGKTELQKLLLSFVPDDEKIIMIEDVAETRIKELFPKKHIFSWITNEDNTITDYIVHGLRNYPTWLSVAEVRGSEVYEFFNAIKSGHAGITTMHSVSNEAVPSRISGMASMDYKIPEEKFERDLLRYLNLGIHIRKKKINKKTIRYIDEIAEFVPISQEHPQGINVIFEQHVNNGGDREINTHKFSDKLTKLIYTQLDKKVKYLENSQEPEKGNFINYPILNKWIDEKHYDFGG